jgi:hypothetical protein
MKRDYSEDECGNCSPPVEMIVKKIEFNDITTTHFKEGKHSVIIQGLDRTTELGKARNDSRSTLMN